MLNFKAIYCHEIYISFYHIDVDIINSLL